MSPEAMGPSSGHLAEVRAGNERIDEAAEQANRDPRAIRRMLNVQGLIGNGATSPRPRFQSGIWRRAARAPDVARSATATVTAFMSDVDDDLTGQRADVADDLTGQRGAAVDQMRLLLVTVGRLRGLHSGRRLSKTRAMSHSSSSGCSAPTTTRTSRSRSGWAQHRQSSSRPISTSTKPRSPDCPAPSRS